MMQSFLSDTVNSWPEALAIETVPSSEDGEPPIRRLIAFSAGEGEGSDASGDALLPQDPDAPGLSPQTPALIVTRPLKLDAPDVLKTIRAIAVRGHFRRGNIRTVLYGSRDLFSWHLVASSRSHFIRNISGSPYRYFRLAILASLSPDESISSISVDFIPRLTNRIR